MACPTKLLTWINIYELLTCGMSDQQKITGLARNLEGEALQWFGEDVLVNMQSLTWAECRSQMLARFGEAVSSPLLEATKRVHNGSEPIAEYHRDKLAKLRLARAQDLDIVGMLTDGLPEKYKCLLITSQVRTPLEWLSVALQLEHNFAQEDNDTTAATASPFIASTTTTRIPSRPCKFCKEKFQRDEYHWHSDCEHAFLTSA